MQKNHGSRRTPQHGHPRGTKTAKALQPGGKRSSAAGRKGTRRGNVRTGRADK